MKCRGFLTPFMASIALRTVSEIEESVWIMA